MNRATSKPSRFGSDSSKVELVYSPRLRRFVERKMPARAAAFGINGICSMPNCIGFLDEQGVCPLCGKQHQAVKVEHVKQAKYYPKELPQGEME
jgi:hypothetical protein